jgi:hypothetical protein
LECDDEVVEFLFLLELQVGKYSWLEEDLMRGFVRSSCAGIIFMAIYKGVWTILEKSCH